MAAAEDDVTQVENMARKIVELEERVSQLEHERDEALDREAGTSDALDEARREADQLRAALEGFLRFHLTKDGPNLLTLVKDAQAALAGVQADQ